MEMLAPQDENAPFGMTRTPSMETKRAFGTPLGISKSGSGKENSAARRILGNITNKSNKSKPLGLEKSASAVVRRTLGDITNSGSTPVSAKTKLNISVKEVATPQERTSLANIYAEDGIEQLAGKSSKELEAERIALQEKEIEERVASFAATRTVLPLPCFGADEQEVGIEGTLDHKFEFDESLDDLECPSSPPATLSPLAAEGGGKPSHLDLDFDVGLPEADLGGECSLGLNLDFEASSEMEIDIC
mmetsp:Transcript_23524/g.28450  ORF Transcript_23524/g.28450 Transcript_23524/m.28450 type:complete len:247 (+) Transcript_23524:149-889(+)|eukprot:CAMPEP_0197848110 /NCGR_PEP_ID=MMETSP1438-20131217/7931_1 /TAXON_ID=1461541 /ORGANISM="Pterosperma sp., Strain CCMP1384" /LENGTH=246 /DNA_ID=CAMNT_0043460245 /DNA_START=149 /DNA_END=889 /DNA_ORIENTATION=-